MWSSRHQAFTVTIVAIRIVQKQENEPTDTPSSSWQFLIISLFSSDWRSSPSVCLADLSISQSRSMAPGYLLCDDTIIASLIVTFNTISLTIPDIIARVS